MIENKQIWVFKFKRLFSKLIVTNVLGLKVVLGTADYWPILLGFIIVPALAHIGLFCAVESPKYEYYIKNDIVKAEASKELDLPYF